MSDEEYSEEEVTEEEEEEEEEEVQQESAEEKRKREEAERKRDEAERKKKAEEDRKAAEAKRHAEAARSADDIKKAKEEEERLKLEEKERKKAEVRARLEAQSQQGKQKKGFLTGARKKKLKAFLRKKIREDMEMEARRKEEERQRVLNERIRPISIEGKNETQLRTLIEELYNTLCGLEEEKFDQQSKIDNFDKQINDTTIEVNNLRGKFVKPVLKKVSKYDSKFAKMSKATQKEEINWRSQLKSTGTSKFAVDIGTEETKAKPEWAGK